MPKSRKGKNSMDKDKQINIALAGNPNVGKSVIFNQLTGLSQTIGNWPGKTIERMEGSLEFLGYHFNIVDLPGIYSLSTYSLEEIVSREYLVSENVDIIVNVIDATNLERNLFFTFQLLELKIPIILAINQMDILQKRNRDLNIRKLLSILKLPVLPVVAVHGRGVHEILEEAIKLASKEQYTFPDLSHILAFGKEIENGLETLTKKLTEFPNIYTKSKYPPRFLAIKLLENDEEVIDMFKDAESFNEIAKIAEESRNILENLHGENIETIISSEIYNNIND
ncbi:MAG: FeoB small GTPase domain-containing protein, partial [Candidatus Hermodarchaeota archaeon]